MAVKLSTTKSLKLQGSVADKNFSKTLSGLDSDYLSNPDGVKAGIDKLYANLVSGQSKTFSIVSTDKYSAE